MSTLLGGMTSTWHAVGHALPGWLLATTLWTALLFVAARLIDAALTRRVSPAWRVLLYGVVVLRLVLPFDWSSPIGLVEHGVAAPGSAAATFVRALVPAAPAAEFTAPRTVVPLLGLWPALYIVGVLLLAGRWLSGWRTARRAADASAPTERVAGNALPVRETDDFGPALVGLLRPVVLVPRTVLASLDQASLVGVLRHEAAHFERRDHWLQAALQLLCVLAWPVAPLWFAVARVRALIEMATDERALRGATHTERNRYMRTLIDLATRSGRRVVPVAAAAFEGRALHARVAALRPRRQWPRTAQGLVVLVALAGLVACTGTRGGSEATSRLVHDDGATLIAITPQLISTEGEDVQCLIETSFIHSAGDPIEITLSGDAQIRTGERLPGGGMITFGDPATFLPYENPDLRVVHALALLAPEGQRASISIGEPSDASRHVAVESDDPIPLERGLLLQVTAHELPENGVRLAIDYREYADGRVVREIRGVEADVPANRTLLVAAEPRDD